jgi:integrase
MAVRSKPIILRDDKKIKLINPETLKLYQKYKIDMSIRELSPKTIKIYDYDLFQWFIYILDNQYNKSVTELDEDDLTEWYFFCKSNGNNSRRMKSRMSATSAFYNFLRKKRIITTSPAEFIDRPIKDVDVLERLFLTEDQVVEMRTKARELNDTQFILYIELSLSTMARVNAVSNITWQQIDFDNRVISNVLEKEQRVVDLYFSEDVKELLLKWKQEREDEGIECDYVFITNYKGWKGVTVGTLGKWAKNAGKLIGLPNVHPHTFRKTTASILKNRGLSLEDVSLLLNHLSTDVSRRFYIKEDTKKLQSEKDKFEI